MLSPDLIAELAAELQRAEQSRSPVEQFSKRHPGMTIEDGYRIGRAWVALQKAGGRQVIGHKIGLTSRAMQISSQIDEPDYGTLLDDMLYVAKADEVLEIPVKNFIAPRVEVELAFVLKAPLAGPNVTVEDVLAATEYITPAIEIIDARIEQFDRHTKAMRKVYDTISDNAANAGIVHRRGRPGLPRRSARDQPPLVRRYPAAERRGRRDGPGRRRAGRSSDRYCLAGQQARALGRASRSGRDRAGRIVHPTGGCPGRRPV